MNNNIKDKKLYNLNHSEYIINNSDDKRKGNIIILDNFFIPQLNRYRRIQIYLPPDYEASDTCYPSLYLHDGQFAFHNQELNIDDIINKLFWSNETKGVIVIAIELLGYILY
jgi:predicted alpha/beta superfamily hydrolase